MFLPNFKHPKKNLKPPTGFRTRVGLCFFVLHSKIYIQINTIYYSRHVIPVYYSTEAHLSVYTEVGLFPQTLVYILILQQNASFVSLLQCMHTHQLAPPRNCRLPSHYICIKVALRWKCVYKCVCMASKRVLVEFVVSCVYGCNLVNCRGFAAFVSLWHCKLPGFRLYSVM